MREIKLLFRENMNEEINKIKEDFPNIKFYSHSRLGNFNQCKRGYYYTYIDKKDQKPSVYSELGTACHTTLEDLYECKVDKLNKELFDNEFNKCKLFGINFPKSKYDIAGGYYKDISAFYNVYNKIEAREGDKFISELGFILRLDETKALMGYIDLLILHTDGTCEIVDFKTSSTFDKNHTIEAGRQLILYKLAIEQLYNIKVNTVSWQMLKYMDVKVGLNKQKTALRGREWVSKCSSQIRKIMSSKGYDKNLIDMYMCLAESTNSIDNLPQDIKEEIKVDVYRRYYEVTEDLIKEYYDYTYSSIEQIENMNNENINDWHCSVDEFFCSNLCSFGETYCKYKN